MISPENADGVAGLTAASGTGSVADCVLAVVRIEAVSACFIDIAACEAQPALKLAMTNRNAALVLANHGARQDVDPRDSDST
jgi:hypothetical protein